MEFECLPGENEQLPKVPVFSPAYTNIALITIALFTSIGIYLLRDIGYTRHQAVLGGSKNSLFKGGALNSVMLAITVHVLKHIYVNVICTAYA
jgi:hypothetical protein